MPHSTTADFFVSLCLAFVGAAAGSVLTQVPRRALAACGSVGLLAYAGEAVLHQSGLSAVAATFLTALTVACIGEMLARLMHLPALCFAVPGVIPLAPGVSAYDAMYRFVVNDTVAGSEFAFQALSISVAIAAGVVLAGAIFRIQGGPRRRRRAP